MAKLTKFVVCGGGMHGNGRAGAVLPGCVAD